MTSALPQPGSLHGDHVWLEPLTSPEQLVSLAPAVQQRAVFAGGWGGGEAAYTENTEDFLAFLRGYLPPFGRPGSGYLVCMPGSGQRAGLVVGTTSYLAVPDGKTGWAPGTTTVEIGCTAYSPSAWGSVINPAAKLLMLSHAFASGMDRVVFNVDQLNERSLAAVARLGAAQVGVTEHDKQRADGSWRDTVTFEVTADTWPGVERGLQERVRSHH